MAFPESAQTIIIGAGVHGLSTAWHLGEILKARGRPADPDAASPQILVLDKGGIGAGASGIACGVIRNNYYQPAMRELMAECVAVWDSDPEAFSYHPVGYMQISPESMRDGCASIHEQQHAIGYDSDFIEGTQQCTDYMRGIFDDWQAQGITNVLHEKKGGYANNTAACYGLAGKAEAAGARIMTGVTVTGLQSANGTGAVTAVETDRGTIQCERVVVAPGPWVKTFWDMLEQPSHISVKGADDVTHDDVEMWHYMCLQEGTLGIDPGVQKTNAGAMPPVIHVDTDAPLMSDVDGSLITESMWGIYYKPDFNFGGIQGGAMPWDVTTPVNDVNVDPYGPESPEFISDDSFAHMWCSALAHCQKRFEGTIGKYKKEPSGGLGCFTPDSFPVIDTFRQNVTLIADSNHGFKMIGIGKLVAQELEGEPSAILHPFRFARYAEGDLHPVSSSPYPWS